MKDLKFSHPQLLTITPLPEQSVQCAVTSPPYWGLRDYGIDGQIGLETTLPQFLNHLIAIFNEVKRFFVTMEPYG